MSKHTPGPWQVNHDDPFQVCDADGERRGCSPIAHVIGISRGEKTANARLIAAAPELLEALETLLMAVRCNAEGGRPRTADEIYAMAGPTAQAAIAKTTGANDDA